MDPSFVTSTILAVCSVLLGLNVFFLKNLVTKIEISSIQASNNATRMDYLQEQVSDIRGMREDIAVLRFAILGHLNGDKIKLPNS